MQLRGLLVAAVAALAAAGLIVWSNRAKEAEAKKPPADASPKLTSIPEADIQQVEIARKSGEKISRTHLPAIGGETGNLDPRRRFGEDLPRPSELT